MVASVQRATRTPGRPARAGGGSGVREPATVKRDSMADVTVTPGPSHAKSPTERPTEPPRRLRVCARTQWH
jgi:hypothetical protein